MFVPASTWDNFRSCIELYDPLKCLPKLTNACLSAKHRIIKLVRTDVVGILPLYNVIPGLKIIQLFRDVRGTVNSRLRTPWYVDEFLQTPQQIENDVTVLCSLIRENLPIAQVLQKEKNDSFKIIQYEDFAKFASKFKLCKLVTWLGMDCSEKHLAQSMRLLKRPENSIGDTNTGMSKSAAGNHPSAAGNHPYLYRTQLDWTTVKVIDKQCRDLHNLLGFKIFTSEKLFRDMGIYMTLSDNLPFAI